MPNSIICPKCESEEILVLAWVDQLGEVSEAAGDCEAPDIDEPKPTAMCSDCDHYFGPPVDGGCFRIESGRPVEMRPYSPESELLDFMFSLFEAPSYFGRAP